MALTLDEINAVRAEMGYFLLDEPYTRTRPPYTPPPHLRDPRWQPWNDADPAFSTLARCAEHKFPPGETVDVVPDGVGGMMPNPNRRSEAELAHGPLVPLHTMVDGMCRGCYERSKRIERGPVHRDLREQRAAKAPATALFDYEPEDQAEPTEEDRAAFEMAFRTEPRRPSST